MLKNLLHLVFFNPEEMFEELAIRRTVKNFRDKGVSDLAGDFCYGVFTRKDIAQAVRNWSLGKPANVWDNAGGRGFNTLNNLEYRSAVRS